MKHFFYTEAMNDREVRIDWEELEWTIVFNPGTDIETARDVIETAIDDWYNIEDFPDYECLAVGDVIDDRLTENGYSFSFED